jgi:XTP/dITP diphosphohydrolase
MRSVADTLLLATRSADKVREIRAILHDTCAVRILSLEDAGVHFDPHEHDVENTDSFLGNAHAKAAWFLALTGLTTLADHSGLSVHALGGAPGVRSRRFAHDTTLHGTDLDRANNERLLHELRAVTDEQRTAHYTCAAVLHEPGGRRCAALGTCSGLILNAPRGTGGFGYDPLFLDPATGLSFGELHPVVKNQRSHRARAFRALASVL